MNATGHVTEKMTLFFFYFRGGGGGYRFSTNIKIDVRFLACIAKYKDTGRM